MRVLNTLKPYSYFKGGVAREALVNHFTPNFINRHSKPLMDLDFVVFGDDVEWDDSMTRKKSSLMMSKKMSIGDYPT